jgi:hypothetical protein
VISLRRSLLRKYSYFGRRSSVDPLRNTPWKRSFVLVRVGTERALRAVSVNCYVRTRPNRVAHDVHTRRRDGELVSLRCDPVKKGVPRAQVAQHAAPRGKATAEKSAHGNRTWQRKRFVRVRIMHSRAITMQRVCLEKNRKCVRMFRRRDRARSRVQVHSARNK